MTTLHTQITPAGREAIEQRFAKSIAARLDERVASLTPEIGERLRFARDQALEAARKARGSDSHPTIGSTAHGAAIAGFSQSRWWLRFASALPLAVLVAGLLLIQEWQDSSQISTAAEVDAALLGDDLPINAYRDAGFVEFLKVPPGE